MPDVSLTASRGRLLAYRITMGVLGVALALGGFTLLSLIGGWFGAGGREIHQIHDIAWGLIGGVLIAAGLLTQMLPPERWVAPAQQAIVGAGALAVGTALGAAFAFAAAPLVVIVIVAALHPSRRVLAGGGERGASVPLLGLAVLALVPMVLYALDQAEVQRACAAALDQHCEEFHYAQMAALALAIPAVGAVAAFRASGWRFTAWCVGLATVLWAAASLLFPDHVSALPTGWAITGVVGGTLFVAVAEWERRRS